MNKEFFDKFYKENKNYFYYFLARKIDNVEDRAEIEQNFWMEVYKLDENNESFNINYLLGILSNLIFAYYRKNNKYDVKLNDTYITDPEGDLVEIDISELNTREKEFYDMFYELKGKNNETNEFIKQKIMAAMNIKERQYYYYLDRIRKKLKP